ncbi:Potassium channel [Irineochytrium annulatum]|nr:Potassium channel [Irineochytrium annulatum]
MVQAQQQPPVQGPPISWKTTLFPERAPGLGYRGKAFLIGSILVCTIGLLRTTRKVIILQHVYVTYAIVRALSIRAWYVVDTEALTAEQKANFASLNITTPGAVEVEYTTPREMILLSIALFLSVLVQIGILLRLLERMVRYAAVYNIVATLATPAIISVTIAMHPFGKYGDLPIVSSQGHLAAHLGNICSFIVFVLFVVDAIQNRLDNRHLGQSRRKLIMGFIYVSWVVAIGGIALRYIENWQFSQSFSFAIQTLTTIGYGNIAPKTLGGRWFVIFYFLLGVGVVGFLLSAIQDSMVEKAEEQFKRRMKRHNLLKNKSPEEIQRLVAQDFFTKLVLFLSPSNNPVGLLHKVGARIDRRHERERLEAARRAEARKVRRDMGQDVDEDEEDDDIDVFDRDREIDEELQRMSERGKLRSVVVLILGWWLLGSAIFCYCEQKANWTYGQSLYFSFVTMATIGYGDVTPIEPLTWEFWNAFVFVSIAILAYLLTLVGEQVGSKFGDAATRATEIRDAKEARRRAMLSGADIKGSTMMLVSDEERARMDREEYERDDRIASSAPVDFRFTNPSVAMQSANVFNDRLRMTQQAPQRQQMQQNQAQSSNMAAPPRGVSRTPV